MEATVENSIRNYCSDRVVTGRLDVVVGPTGRRSWPDEIKGQIVAESFSSNESVSAVARRHGMVPSQLFGWRRLAKDGKLVLPADESAAFAPLIVADGPKPEPVETPVGPSKQIEIEVDGVVIRLADDAPARRIAGIVRALRT